LYLIQPSTNSNFKIKINEIEQVTFDINKGEFRELKKNLSIHDENKNFMEIFYQNKTYDLVFDSSTIMKHFLQSLLILTNYNDERDLDLEENLRRIWKQYDTDFSGKMDHKEFSKFVKDLNINLHETKTIDELFRIIDTDNSGLIDFDEFTNYYRLYNNGLEFKNVFDEYSNKKGFLSAEDFNKFLTQEQGEIVNLSQAAEIISIVKGINFNEIISNKTDPNFSSLKLSLEEFKKFLYDKNYTLVYDIDKLFSYQDMDRPLYHYYINSSHNTYIRGHQITGHSDVEMYTYCLLQGYRLIELDCWNGNDETGPIITHGYTLTNNILMRDVLHAIKKAAFVTSEYPVILSIENHCKDRQLDIMADYFISILEDLYVLDENKVPYDYPKLSELKRKFIIKWKRSRLFRDQSALKILAANDPGNNKSKSQNKNDFIENKNNTKKYFINQNDISVMNSRIDNERQANEFFDKIMNENLVNEEETMKEINSEDKNTKSKKKKGNVNEGKLAAVAGMIGTKLNIKTLKQNNYQPWDCVTIKEEKILGYMRNIEEKKLVMEYSKGSFLKSYPLRMNSSNLDPTKTWICGAQIAAMNAQSLLDDYTLLNHVFFRMNNNCGYVLKPEKFFTSDVIKYDKPVGCLTVEIISGLNLHYLLSSSDGNSKSNPKMSINAFVIGSEEDEKNNERNEIKIEHNFLNPIFHGEAIFSFNIYETFLSSIYFKIMVNGNLRGRCVIPLSLISRGIRIVPIYDNKCREISQSFLVLRLTKKLYN